MNDFTQRKAAAWLTDEAQRIITTERANAHGGAETSFEMIGQMWAIYVMNANVMRHNQETNFIVIDSQDVAEMMSLLKKCRKIHGDPNNTDNWIDDIGYTALGGGMAMDRMKVPPETDAAYDEPVNYAGATAGHAHEWRTDSINEGAPAEYEYTAYMSKAEYEELMKKRHGKSYATMEPTAKPGSFGSLLK